MFDNGTQLKSLGMQLQSFCLQIQNIAFQLANINPIFGTQMLQNAGVQISNLATQIFNIGNQISSIANNIQNSKIISNNMNNIDLINNNEFLRMNNINEINNDSNENEKLSILFVKGTEVIASVVISKEKTLKDLFDSFIIKARLNSDYLNKNFFLYNAKKIYPDNKIKIKDLGFVNGSVITTIQIGI